MKKESIFKNRNFTLSFIGKFVSDFGNIIYNFAQSFYILAFSNNNALLQGVFLAVCGITYGIFALIGGVISDRYNKAKIMYICDFAKGILLLGCGGLAFFFSGESNALLGIIFAVGVISNIIAGLFSPSGSSLLPMIVEEERLQEANSITTLFSSIEQIAGAVIAAILYAALDLWILAVVTGIIYLCSGISELFIKYDYIKGQHDHTIKSALGDIKSGFSYIFKNQQLLIILIIVLFINFFVSPLSSNFMPLFAETTLTEKAYWIKDIISPEMMISLLGILEGLGVITISIVLSKREYQRGRVHIFFRRALSSISLIFLLAAVLYFIFIDQYEYIDAFLIMFTIGSFVLGLSVGYTNIPMSTTIQIITDNKMLGKVSSCADVGCQALIPLSSFISGVILSILGSGALLAFCAIGCGVATLIAVFNKKIEGI